MRWFVSGNREGGRGCRPSEAEFTSNQLGETEIWVSNHGSPSFGPWPFINRPVQPLESSALPFLPWGCRVISKVSTNERRNLAGISVFSSPPSSEKPRGIVPRRQQLLLLQRRNTGCVGEEYIQSTHRSLFFP